MREEYFVTEETAGDRIDKFLAEQYENLSRSFLQKLLKSGEVMVDGRPVKASYKVAEGDLISFEVPEAVEPEIVPEEAEIIRRIYRRYLDEPFQCALRPFQYCVGIWSSTSDHAFVSSCKAGRPVYFPWRILPWRYV